MSGIIGSTEYVEARRWELMKQKPGLPVVFDPERDLRNYLRGAYRRDVPLKLTTRVTDATGHQLTTVMLSRAEVSACIGMLPWRQQKVVELYFDQGVDQGRIAELLGCSRRTVVTELIEAVKALAARIFHS